MTETINLKEIIQILKKRYKLILISIISVLMLSAIFTFFIETPQYRASTQILINQTQESEQPVTTTELQSNRELINTYNVIITSPVILDIVIDEVGIDRTVSQLQDQISVSAEEESQVITISVEDDDPHTATDLANGVAQVFEQEVISIMNIDNVSILSESEYSSSMNPVSPQPSLNLVIALIIGSIIGVGISLLLNFLDQTVKTEQDVEKILNLPVLGSISVITKEIDDNNKNESIKNYRSSEKKSRKTS